MNTKRLLAGALLGAGVLLSAASLEDSFRNPPNEAKPKTWWHWMNNFITRQGITRDLEAMKKVGLGGATILDISCFGKEMRGNVKCLSPEWFEMVNHAVKESDRLGLSLTIHNCPGWSSSGGPWIRPEFAMKELRWSEKVVEGGNKINMILPVYQSPTKHSRDVAVIAYPALPGDGYSFKDEKVKIFSDLDRKIKLPLMPDYMTIEMEKLDFLKDGEWKKVVMVNPKLAKKPQSFYFEFEKPFTAGSMRPGISGPPWGNNAVFEIHVSDDGKNYRKHFTTGRIPKTNDSRGVNVGFPTVTAKYFKISVIETNRGSWLPLNTLALSPAVYIPEISRKTFLTHETFLRDPFWKTVMQIPKANTIPMNAILDITDKMDKTGRLVWNAPKGRWTILRFTEIARRSCNHPANPEGTGLECDKMSKEGVDEVWRGMMAPIVKNAGKLAGKSLQYTLIDSYEVGPQNWTARMPEEFRELRSYDLRKYLPVLTGRCIESTEVSERFLQDFRRTVSDLFAKYYGKYYAELIHKNKLGFETEPYGGVFDELLQGEHADVPMSEFWRGFNGTGNAKLASNIANVNGRKFVQTETFTAGVGNGAWSSFPEVHKIQGDAAFCAGVNRFVFHSYAHQPWDCDTPGMTMGQWGFHFNRNNSLWNFYPGWLAYIARAQYLLQQGHTKVDVLYIGTENTPSSANYSPAAPAGYNVNCSDPRSFRNKVNFKGSGKIGFSHGLSYELLVLNETDQGVPPETLEKIVSLVEQGAKVLLGERPEKAFGLSGYPSSDKKIAALTEKLWGGLDGKTKTEKELGKGKIFYGVTPGEIFSKQKLVPDFEAKSLPSEAEIRFIHRTLPGYEIYFVANVSKRKTTLHFPAEFRVSGMIPELWDAGTGKISKVPVYSERNGVTTIPMTLDYSGSAFIVFRPGKSGRHLTSANWKGEVKEVQNLVIAKAFWRAKDGSKSKDVTEFLNKKISGGVLRIEATASALGGDSAPGKIKELYLEYTLDGKLGKVTLPEWHSHLLQSKAPAGDPKGGRFELVAEQDGKITLFAETNGVLEVRDSSGASKKITVDHVSKSRDLSSNWNVAFQKGRGAPENIVMPKLQPLNEYIEPGIRYFSGESVYTRNFDLAKNDLNSSKIVIDLGNVHDVCRVSVNGKDLGFVWHQPYRLDVTNAVKTGSNKLEVRVANRWINRLIGDEQLPPDSEWNKNDANSFLIKKLPEWFKQGKKSPTGRIAFTTFRYWKKNSKLMPAGLAGPVRLAIIKKVTVL